MKKFSNILVIAAVLLVTLFPTITHSASATEGLEVESYVIDLQPVANELLVYVSAGLAAVGAWLIGGILLLLRKNYKLEVDNKVREYLDEALYTALQWAMERLRDPSGNIVIPNPHVKNQMLAEAANYALKRVPDAIKHFGITPEGLKEMFEARLPDLYPVVPAEIVEDKASA